MVRVDNRQDSDRPHYYSQFWIDVTMGKQSPISIHAPAEEEEEEEEAFVAAAPKAEPKPKVSKPAEKKPEAPPTLTSLADLANIDMLMKSSAAMEDDLAPDIAAGIGEEAPGVEFDGSLAEEDLAASEAEPVDEFDEFDEEVEEEEDWSAGRHKPKQSKPKRRERRDY